MSTTIKLQTLREGTKYASYRITLPKSIIEAKNWTKTEFKLTLQKNNIILTPKK